MANANNAERKTALKRLTRELRELEIEQPPGISVAVDDEDMFTWHAIIAGPDDTIWDGGVFRLLIKFPDNYPYSPPAISFDPLIYHVNVYDAASATPGLICVDILLETYDPAYSMRLILLAISQFLDQPNTQSPANNEASNLMDESPAEYEKKVREEVEKSWKRVD